MLIAVYKKKITVSFIVIFGPLASAVDGLV